MSSRFTSFPRKMVLVGISCYAEVAIWFLRFPLRRILNRLNQLANEFS